MNRPLALCADDYAFTPAVSAGIREALAAGRITATSVMASRPGWPREADALKAALGEAEAGLHLTLTVGAPLGPKPAFAPDGVFPALGAVVKQAVAGRLPMSEIAAEIDRQLDAFEAGFGAPPAFADGHQHVQALPGVREALFEALARRGWMRRVWLRDSADALARIVRRGVETRKALTVAALASGFAAAARARGIAVNDGFSGFSPFDPARDFAADFARYLVAPGDAHLVMCHPGRVDDALRRLDPVTEARERELAFFLSDEFVDLLAARGARSVKVCCILEKPGKRAVQIDADFVGFHTPDLFVVGYGMDVAHSYRELPYIGVVETEA